MIKSSTVIIFLLFSNAVMNPVLAAWPESSFAGKKVDDSVKSLSPEKPKEKPKDVPPEKSTKKRELDIPKKRFIAKPITTKPTLVITPAFTNKDIATTAAKNKIKSNKTGKKKP